MKMRRCKYCGWWFEPHHGRQVFCDDECKKESQLERWRRRYHEKKTEEKKPSIMKVDVSKLPPPTLPPTKEYRAKTKEDYKLQHMFEAMERRRQFEAL